MKASIFAFLLFIGQSSAKDFCNEKLRTYVTEAEELINGTLLTTDGEQYPKGTFWKEEEGFWWACPCLLHPCIRVCDHAFATEIFQVLLEDAPAPIPWDEIYYANKTASRGRFKYVHEAVCEDIAYFLDKGTFKILDNGELELEGQEQNLDATHYCVHHVEENAAHVIHCIEPEEYHPPLKFNLYPPFFILSSIFLLLTILALVLTPEIKSFHSKCVVCHSACLVVAFIALTLNYLHGNPDERVLCVTIGYTALYSFHASVFWLNSLCVDIFLIFKGVVRTRGGTRFVKFTVYSLGAPMAITIVALIFNLINDEDSIFNSRLGENSCWMEDGSYALWMFFLGPTLMLLMANLALLLFTASAFNVTRTEPESVRALKKTMQQQDSNVHNMQPRWLYVKLSVLVGFPWIIEVLHPIVGGADAYWYIPDVLNASRGAFVFFLCVVQNEEVMKSLRGTFWKQRGDGSLEANTSSSEPAKLAATQV
ncbi:probable G-protein coupled receptor Mth-like 3 [Cloeon dipterum]|uniref:probable G-protein coupled receptor Mth-like 3 n=1 Tax=Cloeon dipterum TaxID=197152 RepID=UPI00322054BA